MNDQTQLGAEKWYIQKKKRAFYGKDKGRRERSSPAGMGTHTVRDATLVACPPLLRKFMFWILQLVNCMNKIEDWKFSYWKGNVIQKHLLNMYCDFLPRSCEPTSSSLKKLKQMDAVAEWLLKNYASSTFHFFQMEI